MILIDGKKEAALLREELKNLKLIIKDVDSMQRVILKKVQK